MYLSIHLSLIHISTQPIIQAIRVERVVSKITFTPNNNDNKYNVKVKVTTIPVSYTHLDVYKRQGIVRIMLGQVYNVEWRLEVVVRFKSYG